MKDESKYSLAAIIDLIYKKYHSLLPFLNVFRKSINSLQFLELSDDTTAEIRLINKKFEIIINTNYVEKNNLTPDDVLWILCHEIGHFILDHLHYEKINNYSGDFLNFAFDAQVNSMLFNINDRKQIEVLSKTYGIHYEKFIKGEEENNFYFLLAPPSLSKKQILKDIGKTKIENEKKKLIPEFWFENYSKKGLSLDEIISYLLKILPNEQFDNNSTNENIYELNELPDELNELIDNLKNTNGNNVDEEIFEFDSNEIAPRKSEIDDSVSIRNSNIDLLRRAITAALFDDKNNLHELDSFKLRSVFPNLGRRESLLLEEDVVPLFYDYNFELPEEKKVAVYIDFSISTGRYHSKIAKTIASLRSKFKGPYYAFSQTVEEISYDELLKGDFTVAGTYIEPVVEHINKHKFQKALLITDGEFLDSKIKTKADLFAILFSRSNSAKALRSCGNLKEIWFFEN